MTFEVITSPDCDPQISQLISINHRYNFVKPVIVANTKRLES